jgi:hypothetical protein
MRTQTHGARPTLWNHLSEDVLDCLVRFLDGAAAMRVFSLLEKRTCECMEPYLKAIKQLPSRWRRSINYMDYTPQSLNENQISALGKLLSSNVNIIKLVVHRSTLCDEGAATLAKGLEVNATLKVLHLDCSKIGGEGAAAIGKALTVNATLNQLHLQFTGIGDEGASALAKGLAVNATLKMLIVPNGVENHAELKAVCAAKGIKLV